MNLSTRAHLNTRAHSHPRTHLEVDLQLWSTHTCLRSRTHGWRMISSSSLRTRNTSGSARLGLAPRSAAVPLPAPPALPLSLSDSHEELQSPDCATMPRDMIVESRAQRSAEKPVDYSCSHSAGGCARSPPWSAGRTHSVKVRWQHVITETNVTQLYQRCATPAAR